MSKRGFSLVSALVVGAIGLAIGGYSLIGGQVQAGNQDGGTTGSNLYRFSDASVVEGASSTLVRTDDGLNATIQTGDLEPGHAYTMWWVIFNNPEQCQHGMPGLSNCGEGDVFGEPFGETAVRVSVQYGAGNVIGETGQVNFGAHLNENELPTDAGQVVFGSGLFDNNKAEVHLVVRDHGPSVPGMEYAQITTFGGSCTTETDPTQVGPIGTNTCADQQFAIFMP